MKHEYLCELVERMTEDWSEADYINFVFDRLYDEYNRKSETYIRERLEDYNGEAS